MLPGRRVVPRARERAAAACFTLLDTEPYVKLGRKAAGFRDGDQFRATRFGRRGRVAPILSGELTIDRRFGAVRAATCGPSPGPPGPPSPRRSTRPAS